MKVKWGKLKIVGASLAMLLACAVVGVSLYAYFNRTISWFTQNKNVGAEGMMVSAEENNKIHISRMLVYRYDVSEEHVKVKVDDPSSPNYFKLNQYDTVFTERQAYTPMVIKTPVELTKGKAFTIHFTCNGALFNDDGLMDSNLSNVITVKCGMSNTLDAVENDETDNTAETFYKAATEFFTKTGTEVAGDASAPVDQSEKYCTREFVQYDEETKTYSKNRDAQGITEFTISIGDHTTKVYEGFSDQPQANIYFYVDYDPVLMAKYIDDNITISAEFLEGQTVVFKKDILAIVFGDAEEETEEESN